MGVVLHGTNFWRSLLEKQAQSDVLWYFKQLISESQIGYTMFDVHGQMIRISSTLLGALLRMPSFCSPSKLPL